MSIKVKEVPIGIGNAVLAFALDLAGIPPAEQPCVNLFDPDMLFRIGGGEKDPKGNVTRPSRFNGMKPFDAATAAWRERAQGKVTYRFQRTKKLDSLCRAFTDQEKKVAVGETVDTTKMVEEITSAMVNGEIDRQEAIVRLTCVMVKTYITHKNQWKGVIPLLQVPNVGPVRQFETTVDTTDAKGNRITVPAKGVSSPGYRLVSLNASEETRKRLKL